MVTGYKNGTIVRTGLSLVAVLMLSGAAFAGPATATAGNAVVPEPGFGGDLIAVQATDEVTTGGEGIAVGEPDPSGDGPGGDQTTGDGTGGGTGDGTDVGTGDGTDGSTGDGTDVGTGDGTDGSTGDGSTGDGSTGGGTDVGTGDATDGGAVGDGTVDEVWISDGTGDPVVVDGTGGDPVANDGSVPVEGGTIDFGDGTVGIYYMDAGPSRCGGCEHQDTAGPLIQPPMNFRGHQPAAHQPQIVTGSDREVTRQPVARGAAACLAQHPGLAWMCEWQSGANQ